MTTWQDSWRPARLEERLDGGAVRCHLSPRNCVIKPGQHGFCGVRANRDGRLVTLNWGKSVHATEETIETEAVFHYAPGERILSMGNIGCMMNCDYCHNWKTSQARHVSDSDVYHYTPQQVVDIAVNHGIRVISWTYNDPVVWHEFVTETAALARSRGIVNLFKSAFFITPEAIEELLPVIDIFSISVKSMDPVYYRKLTKGWLEPVLEGAKLVHRAGKHVEISTLMVTDVSDDLRTAMAIADFVGQQLDPSVPLHFVRFHPDYKMTASTRTPIPRLEAARAAALDSGIQHVYLGNVYDHDGVDTRCHACQELLVSRYGLNARLLALTPAGRCRACGADAHMRQFPSAAVDRPMTAADAVDASLRRASHLWKGDIRSLHIQVRNHGATPAAVHTRRIEAASPAAWSTLTLAPGESYRFIAAKASAGEQGVEVAVPATVASSLHEVFDRAHFPTVASDAGTLNGDISPLPGFLSMKSAMTASPQTGGDGDG